MKKDLKDCVPYWYLEVLDGEIIELKNMIDEIGKLPSATESFKSDAEKLNKEM